MSGTDDLKNLLAKSRQVASGAGPGPDDEDAPTDMLSGSALQAALGQGGTPPPFAPPAAGPGPAPAQRSGQFPAPPPQQSGQFPAPPAQRSGQFPAPPQQSGQFPAPPAQQSGQFRAPPAQQSGQFPAPPMQPSGAFPAPGAPPSGQFPAPGAQASGAFAAPPPQQSGTFAAPPVNATGGFAVQSGSFGAPMQSGSFTAPAQPLAPSGEYGMIPDIGAQSREDVAQLPPPPASATKRSALAVTATILVGVIAFLIIAKLVVDGWVAPAKAVVWMAAGTVLPTLLVGLLMAWPNRERGGVKDILAALIPAAAVSGGAIFVATMWTQPAIRAAAVPMVPQTPAMMVAVLDDPAEDVALAGCRRFGQLHDDTDFRTQLFATLTLRPTLAMRCMEQLPEEARYGIATSLFDRWSRELAVDEEAPDAERLCATAGGLDSLPLDRDVIGAQLLQCAISAPTAVAQGCCGKSLAARVVDGKQFAGHLRASMAHIDDATTATGVFAMAFHQQNLSEQQKKFVEDVKFSGLEAQLAALEFACDSIEDGRVDVIPHMRAALDGKCDIGVGEIPQTRSIWSEVCFLSLAELAADKTLPPTSVLCETTKDVVGTETIEMARKLVHLGLKKDAQGSIASQINSGYNRVLDQLGTAEGSTQDVPDFVSDEDAQRARMARYRDDPFAPAHNEEHRAQGDTDYDAFRKAYEAKKESEE